MSILTAAISSLIGPVADMSAPGSVARRKHNRLLQIGKALWRNPQANRGRMSILPSFPFGRKAPQRESELRLFS